MAKKKTDPTDAPATTAPPANKPSIGRIVHYTPKEDKGKGQPYPAVITHVHSGNVVNLNVFNDGGVGYSPADKLPTSVPSGSGPGTWAWPPRV